MNSELDLTLEVLDALEVPLSDYEGGLICGACFGVGVIGGVLIGLAILT